jgi:hypothetical protein
MPHVVGEPAWRILCQNLPRRGDPELSFTAEIPLSLETSTI